MTPTCPTCDRDFTPRRAAGGQRYCSRKCHADRPRDERPANPDLERLVIRTARALAVELGTRYLDLFTGPRAEWARCVVTERVRRVRDEGTSVVCGAVNAVLVAQRDVL